MKLLCHTPWGSEGLGNACHGVGYPSFAAAYWLMILSCHAAFLMWRRWIFFLLPCALVLAAARGCSEMHFHAGP